MDHDLHLDRLSDDALLDGIGAAVQNDNEQTAVLLRYVAEVDRRSLWQRCGHSSLFEFLVQRFHVSEAKAYRRIRAARAGREFPVLFDMVARGELHLTAIHMLAAHLTTDNHRAVLAEAKHKRQKELAQLLARLAPQPDLPSRVRKLPTPRAERPAVESTPLLSLAERAEARSADTTPIAPPVPSPPAPPPRAPDPKPLSPGRYGLHVTMSEETNKKLERLQGLHAHEIPDGDPAKIVDRAFDALLEKTLKRKAAITDRPREQATPRSGGSRHIPAQVRRVVWERDGGTCAFVGEDGHRCNETRFIEFAHLEPWGRGGAHTTDNVGLRCRVHNGYEAVRDYGPLFMARKIEAARGTRDSVAIYRQSGRLEPLRGIRRGRDWSRDPFGNVPQSRSSTRAEQS